MNGAKLQDRTSNSPARAMNTTLTKMWRFGKGIRRSQDGNRGTERTASPRVMIDDVLWIKDYKRSTTILFLKRRTSLLANCQIISSPRLICSKNGGSN